MYNFNVTCLAENEDSYFKKLIDDLSDLPISHELLDDVNDIYEYLTAQVLKNDQIEVDISKDFGITTFSSASTPRYSKGEVTITLISSSDQLKQPYVFCELYELSTTNSDLKPRLSVHELHVKSKQDETLTPSTEPMYISAVQSNAFIWKLPKFWLQKCKKSNLQKTLLRKYQRLYKIEPRNDDVIVNMVTKQLLNNDSSYDALCLGITICQKCYISPSGYRKASETKYSSIITRIDELQPKQNINSVCKRPSS